MADTKDIWNDNDGEEAAPRRHPLRKFLAFFCTLAVVLAVVVLAAYRDGTGFDVLRRYFNYGGAEKAGGDTVYDYDASPSNRFALLGDHLVVLSSTALRVLDQNGGEVWSTPVKMEAPALAVGGGRAAAYDVGGTELYVVDEDGLLLELPAQEAEPYIAASLNAKGYLAVTAEKKNYKGCVTVYDKDLEELFQFKSSRRFVTDAYVTDDGDTLAAVTLGQENSVFISNVVLYDLTVTGPASAYDASGGLAVDPAADYSISDGLVAAIGQQGDLLATVSDTCLTYATQKGKVEAAYSYGGAYLREFDLRGEDFSVLLLNRYQTGSVGRLVTVGPDGTELGSLDVNQEVLGLSAAGRYLAVLYMDSLVIYNRELQVYASLRGTDYAKSVLMRPDGSALLLSSESAGLFLP